MAASRSPIVAGIGLAAAAGLFAFGTVRARAPRAPSTQVAQAAAALDGELRRGLDDVRARSTDLSRTPRLAAAISTDAATVDDLTDDELGFRAADGETIEIGQIRGGHAASLRKVPRASDVTAPLDDVGLHFRWTPPRLWVTEVSTLAPLEPMGDLRGALAVTRAIDLGGALDTIARAAPAARLELANLTIPLGAEPSGATAVVALPGSGARLVVALPAAQGDGGLRAGGVALAVLSVLAVLLLARRAPGAAASASERAAAPAAATPSQERAAEAEAYVTADTGPPRATSTANPPPAPRPSAPQQTELAHLPTLASGVTPVPGEEGAPPARGAMRERLGRYQLVRPIGAGGMAEVFLARATGEAGFEKQVALKVLHPSLARNQRAVDHFLDEARLASHLSHPNIVQITDLGRAGDEYFIAMEYVEGCDLDQLLYGARRRGVQVPIAIGLTILRRVCDGLHAAHSAAGPDGRPLDLVHRDVKSANVLISTNGVVKIVDFGIAKASQQLHVTSVGETKGTAAVMAPEQRIGKPVDRRADVYGAGALGYELLVGTEVNLDLAALIHLSVEGWPHLPPPSSRRPELPAELDAVLFRALAFEPEARHASCLALEEDLDRIATKHGLVATDKQIAQWVAAERAENAARAAGDPSARDSGVVAS